MRLAITGATGFVGSHLATLLRSLNHDVRALVRPTSHTDHLQSLGVPCRVTSLDDPASLTRSLEGCDLLIHLAGAVDLGSVATIHRELEAAIEACKGG